MFFKKKKEEKPKKSFEEKLEEWAKRYGLPKESIEHIGSLYGNANEGLLKILARADPEGRHDRVSKALGTKKIPLGAGYILYITHIKKADYQKLRDERDPRAARFPILHGLLTLALIHHTGTSYETLGDAVRRALDNWILRGYYYEDIKQNPELFINELLRQLEKRQAIINKELAEKNLRTALEKAIKITDKMPPDFKDSEKVQAVGKAISGIADDPIHILKQAGIDIEPELEEFRQFLAEISGKKVQMPFESKPKTADSIINLEAQKLLGILSGLKFAGYSQEAVERAIEELDAQIERLMDEKNLELLGLYLGFQRLLKRDEFERAGRFLERFAGN